MRKIGLIVNPVSGNGKALRILPEIKSYFNTHSAHVKLIVKISKYKGNIQELAEELYDNNIREFVVLGGDGSLSELLNGVAKFNNPNVTLGIIPYGSGNDYVKTVFEKYTLNGIFQSIISNQKKRVDIGKVNEFYFINSCTFGIDGPIMRYTDYLKQKIPGEMAYYVSTIKEGVKFKSRHVTLTLDQQKIDGKKLMIVFNKGKYIGGGMKITPEAENDNGEFSVCIIDDVSKMYFVRNIKKVYNGTLDEMPEVTYTKSKNGFIVVEGEPYDINIDGNLVGKTPAQIEIIEKGIEIYC